MGENKRKRGRKPKNRASETLDFQTTATATTSSSSPVIDDDVVFSVANVELIDNPSSAAIHHHHLRRRGRSVKNPDHAEKKPEKALISCNGTTSGSHNLVSFENVAVARAVPSMDAVVKVFCTHTEPNFSLPWQRKRQYSSSSSGFVISGRRVLTNAHSVEHYTQVKLKKRGSDTKYVATVLAIGTECDIALLTVESDEFWEGVSPVQFGDLPALQDAVTVVGYPIGGDTISVTSGVVSRIEILSYVHGSTELLGLQIDAAINSGNSGGPAFNDKGNCVGIAFQSLKHEDAENIGYVIPTPVIMHFIRDYEKNGAYTGFPILGVEWQKMENPDMRMAMGMKPDQKSVRIRRIDPTALESEVLKPSDILLSFDGVDIANDGTVQKPREQVADAETLLDLTKTLYSSAKSHANKGVNSSDFISSLLRNFTNTRGRRGALESAHNSIIWKDIGFPVAPIFKNFKGYCIMLGPMKSEPKQRKIAVYRKRAKPTGCSQPKELHNTGEERTDTDKNMSTMFEILRKKNSVKLESLIVNRTSFAQTVENLFALSFLVKDGRVEMAVDEKGTHLVCEWQVYK